MPPNDVDSWLFLSRRDADLSDSTKVLIAELAYHFQGGVDRMSQKYLAKLLGWSEPTVRRAVRQAIESGWLERARATFGKSNRYRAVWPARLVA